MDDRPLNPYAEALKYLKRANDLREHGDLQQALLECERACRLTPDWAEPHYLRGFLLKALGQAQEAAEAFQLAKSLDLSPRKTAPPPTPKTSLGNEPSVPWTNRDAWWGLALDLAFYIPIPLVLLLVLDALSIDLDTPITLLLLFGPLGSLVPVWWFAVRKYGVGLSTLGFRRFTGNSLGIGCGLLVAAYIGMIIYGAIITYLIGWDMGSNLESDGGEFSVPKWVITLSAIVIAPLVEETFFRGFVFTGFRQRYGWRTAAIISAAIFSVLHLIPLAIPPLFLFGFLLAYIYHRSGSLWVPIILHAIYNSWILVATFTDLGNEEGLIDWIPRISTSCHSALIGIQ